MILFSIITPTYNRSDLLPQMIESVLRQTYTNWELIIVDDGSIDNTVELMRGYLIDSRIKYLKKANSGAAHSRNVGAENALGNFITFLDSDDLVKESWLQSVYEKIEEGTGIVSVGAIKVFSNGAQVYEKPSKIKFYSKEFTVKFTAGSLFIRNDLLKAIRGYDESLQANHHTDLFYRLMILWEKQPFYVSHIDGCLVQINIHEGERIRTNWNKVKLGTLSFVTKHHSFLEVQQKDFLANSYSVIAHSCSRLKNKAETLKYATKAIKYRPAYLKNYLRFLKYLILG